jgi:hypothetical protein
MPQMAEKAVLIVPDCYDYVRKTYGVPAYIGVRVQLLGGTMGTIVPAKHSLNYVHIRIDGARTSGVYHPTDGLTYLLEQQFVQPIE